MFQLYSTGLFRFLPIFLVVLSILFSFTTCKKKEIFSDGHLRQDVSYIIGENTLVLEDSEGCSFTPGVDILSLAQFFSDQVVLTNGLEYDVQRCGQTRARTYLEFTPVPERLERYSITREFILEKVQSQDYSNVTHNIEICHNGLRYQVKTPIISQRNRPIGANFVSVAVNDRSTDCRIVSENTLFVDFQFKGFLFNVENVTDSLEVNFPECRYYFPI